MKDSAALGRALDKLDQERKVLHFISLVAKL